MTTAPTADIRHIGATTIVDPESDERLPIDVWTDGSLYWVTTDYKDQLTHIVPGDEPASGWLVAHDPAYVAKGRSWSQLTARLRYVASQRRDTHWDDDARDSALAKALLAAVRSVRFAA